MRLSLARRYGRRPMNAPPPAEGPEAATAIATTAAAQAIRRLGHALATAELDPELANRLTATLHGLTAELDAAPRRDKEAERAQHSTRYAALLDGRLPEETPDGAPIEFDRNSVVGGPLSPFGLGATHHRDGDEAVCTLTYGPAFEGPPGRVHGGAVALVVDEATATVLPMLGRFGFTGSVSVRLVAPAPLDVPVEFRSRLVGEEGRKLFVRCVGSSPEGTFVEAEATYIQVDPATVPWIAAGRARMAADGAGQGAERRC
jgi:acyl-coenzyme A thioesterase PaaI-like protein